LRAHRTDRNPCPWCGGSWGTLRNCC
jgi:hypothetical protein